MSVMVRIPTPLRRLTQGEDKVSVEGENLGEVVDALEAQFTGIKDRLCDEAGELRNFVNIYITGEDVRFLDGLKTDTSDGDEISVVPAVAGGAGLGLALPAPREGHRGGPSRPRRWFRQRRAAVERGLE